MSRFRRPLMSGQAYGNTADEYGPHIDGVGRLSLWAGVVVWLAAVVMTRLRAGAWTSPDYKLFLVPWYEHLARHGFRSSFSHAFASYNMPYLYMLYVGSKLHLGARLTIKGIANLFDVLLALGVFRLVAGFVGRTRGALAAGLVLLLPTVWFNSAVWGQVDAMYTCFLLFSLDAWLRRRQKLAWFWWGVAFAMKLQAIFLLPFLVLAFLLNRRRSWVAPLLCLVAPVLSLVPAALCGMPLKDLTSAYVGQVSSTPFLNRAPTFWLLTSKGGISSMPLVPTCTWVTLAVLAGFCVALGRNHHWDVDPRRMVAAAAAMALVMPYFLPDMRNRYLYVAELLILVWAFIMPGRWWVCLLMEVSVFQTYPLELMHLQPVLGSRFWALVIGAVLVVMARDALCEIPAAPLAPGRAPMGPRRGTDWRVADGLNAGEGFGSTATTAAR